MAARAFSSTPQSSCGQDNETLLQHRPVRSLPLPLLDHVTVCFEEQLYTQAFSLLTSLLASGTGGSRYAYIPPAQHVALAATLVVHPSMTTRTSADDKHAASDDGLRYLLLLSRLAGSEHSNFSNAFRFRKFDAARSKRARARRSNQSSDEDDDKPGRIQSQFVGSESLWSSAVDIWSIFGWAFNCSVLHKHRWRRWKLLISCLIEILEQEVRVWTSRFASPATKRRRFTNQTDSQSPLLTQYLNSVGEGRNNKRRVMRAILADGSSKALAEFGEIWKDETRPPRQKKGSKALRKRKLDLERDDYGDYDQDSDDPSLDSASRHSRSTTRRPSRNPSRAASAEESVDEDGDDNQEAHAALNNIEKLGGMESLLLRQRLLALLVRYCTVSPESFLDIEDLFDLYTEFLRSLPLPLFEHFVLPIKRYLDDNDQASLDQMLLRPLLDASAPVYNKNALTQADFETFYAPYAANVTSISENAKVSLLLEDLLRLLWKTGALTPSNRLRDVIREGIEARDAKVGFDGRRKTEVRAREEEEWAAIMDASAGRLLAIMDMLD